jgi:hypothetical protein
MYPSIPEKRLKISEEIEAPGHVNLTGRTLIDRFAFACPLVLSAARVRSLPGTRDLSPHSKRGINPREATMNAICELSSFRSSKGKKALRRKG